VGCTSGRGFWHDEDPEACESRLQIWFAATHHYGR